MSWRDVKSHFGRKHTIGTMSNEKLDQLEKNRAEASKKNYDDMKKYIDKNEWEKHLKNKVKDKVRDKQNESWKKKSEGNPSLDYNDI